MKFILRDFQSIPYNLLEFNIYLFYNENKRNSVDKLRIARARNFLSCLFGISDGRRISILYNANIDILYRYLIS